jgi:hypothetical protein
MSKVHVIKDENLGGVLREFVEVDRKAEVGEYIIRDGVVRKVTQRGIHPESVEFEGYYDEGCDDEIIGWLDGTYKTLEPTDIVHIDDPSGQPKRYRMVEREAEVGERIIIIDAEIEDYLSNYKNGDVFTVFDIDYDGRATEVHPNVFDDKIDVILPYEYRVLEPVHKCDQCGKALGEFSCTNSKGGSHCSAKCANADEETSPTVHEMLANLSEQIVKLNRRIDRLADANEQAVATVARDVERVDADLIKLRKEFEDSKDVNLTLSSELVAKLIEKGLSD